MDTPVFILAAGAPRVEARGSPVIGMFGRAGASNVVPGAEK